MARANRAGLAAVERNGDPEVRGRRVEWWTLGPPAQARWFRNLRDVDAVRFVATEKGFPAPNNLLAPAGLVYRRRVWIVLSDANRGVAAAATRTFARAPGTRS